MGICSLSPPTSLVIDTLYSTGIINISNRLTICAKTHLSWPNSPSPATVGEFDIYAVFEARSIIFRLRTVFLSAGLYQYDPRYSLTLVSLHTWILTTFPDYPSFGDNQG